MGLSHAYDMAANLKKRTTSTLAERIQQQRTVNVALDVRGPHVIIPSDPAAANPELLVVETGHFELRSVPQQKVSVWGGGGVRAWL